MDRVKAILGFIFKLGIIPSGYLTVGSGVVSILLGLACMAGIAPSGFECPADPWTLVIGGLAAIGLGRRG